MFKNLEASSNKPSRSEEDSPTPLKAEIFENLEVPNDEFNYFGKEDAILLKTESLIRNREISSIKRLSPIDQLRILPSIIIVNRELDEYSFDIDRFGTFDTLKEIEDDSKTAPLVKALLKDHLSLRQELINNPSFEEASDEQLAQEDVGQGLLHSQFPNLPQDKTILPASKDTVISLDYYARPLSISDKNGKITSLINPESSQNELNLDYDTRILLSAAHFEETSSTITKLLNLNITNLSLKSQIQLLKFMTTQDSTRFNSLCSTLKKIPSEPLRLNLAENFLATGFGEDFGDSLLEIANSDKIPEKSLSKLLESLSSCRSSIESITSFYSGFDDGKFASEYSRASNERLTDILAAFREISKTGSASADLDYFGKTHFSLKTALEALGHEQKSLEIISGILSDLQEKRPGSFAEQVLTPDEYHWRSLYSLYSKDHGYCLLYTRPEGSSIFDPDLEYGNKNGVEASISFITNPINPFSLPNPFRPDLKKLKNPDYYDAPAMNKVSALRLDREGRTANSAPNDPSRTPINTSGSVSVDLAAINDRADTPSGKIARLISTGNKLRSSSLFPAAQTSLNHNINFFTQEKYGSAEGFKNLVDYVDEKILRYCKSLPPSPNSLAESFTSLRRASHRNTGKKALSVLK